MPTVARRGARPGWWFGALALAALVFWRSSSAEGLDRFGLLALPGADKLAHAATFGLLAALVLFASARPRLALLIASLYGLSDEIHQAFVPGRRADPLDWLADTVGALLAVAAVEFLTRRRAPRADPVQWRRDS